MVSSRGWRPDRLPILAGLPLFIMAGSASSAASGVRCTRRLGSGWGRKPSSPTADLSALIGDGSSSHQRPPGAVPPVSKAGHQLRGEMLEETGPDGEVRGWDHAYTSHGAEFAVVDDGFAEILYSYGTVEGYEMRRSYPSCTFPIRVKGFSLFNDVARSANERQQSCCCN